MKLEYVAEYLKLSPEIIKDNLFGVRVGGAGVTCIILLGLWLLNYKICFKLLATGFVVLMIVGWLAYRDEKRAFRIHFLYCGIVNLWLSIFSLIDNLLIIQKEFRLDLNLTAQVFCGVYLLNAVGMFFYRQWALGRGHYTAAYQKKKAKITAIFAHLVILMPGLLLILNVVMKRALGEKVFYSGVIIISSLMPYFLLLVAVLYLHKHYLLMRYGARIKGIKSESA